MTGSLFKTRYISISLIITALSWDSNLLSQPRVDSLFKTAQIFSIVDLSIGKAITSIIGNGPNVADAWLIIESLASRNYSIE